LILGKFNTSPGKIDPKSYAKKLTQQFVEEYIELNMTIKVPTKELKDS
jgi:hypothetical protein